MVGVISAPLPECHLRQEIACPSLPTWVPELLGEFHRLAGRLFRISLLRRDPCPAALSPHRNHGQRSPAPLLDSDPAVPPVTPRDPVPGLGPFTIFSAELLQSIITVGSRCAVRRGVG